MEAMDLTVIILSFNTKELLKKCLQSTFEKKWKYKIQIMVVDNDSSDGSPEMVKKDFSEAELIKASKNLGFAGGNNLGLKKAKSRYCLLLNSDTIVQDNSLDQLIDFMDNGGYGIGSCKLLNEDKSLQPNSGELPLGLPLFVWLAGLDDVMPRIKSLLPSFHRQFAQFYKGTREVGWVSGSVMVIKKDVMDKVGFLDDAIFMYGEDVEYCLRAKRAGFKVGWTDQAQVIHLGGRSWQNPSLNQWTGEFRGLLYIYRKYFGNIACWSLRVFIYMFTMVRILAFALMGKYQASKTYAKIIFSL